MAVKPIRISRHARFEMKRRGISPSLVIGMIRSPAQVVASSRDRSIYQGLIGRARSMLLRVVVAESDAAYHVITAYKTSKIAKYWRSP